MKATLYILAVLACSDVNGLLLPGWRGHRNPGQALSWFSRVRRYPLPTHRIIDPTEDCFLVTSEEGELFFKSPSDEPTVCGIYMIAEPDKRIQVIFNYLDVPCDNGGLVAWVDGWELNGQVWPADSWNDDRVVESCDKRPQRKLVSRQNAALVQYRVPARGKGFAITIRHLRNAKPCNVMLFGAEGVYTLRNHGETGNCSLIAVSPTTVRVLDLNVGQAVKMATLLDLETGTIHHCTKRGLDDYVDIGGANGLDHTKMEVYDSICGLDSNEARRPTLVACEDTVVRLVSSGRFHNSITLAFAPLPVEHIAIRCVAILGTKLKCLCAGNYTGTLSLLTETQPGCFTVEIGQVVVLPQTDLHNVLPLLTLPMLLINFSLILIE